MTIEEREHAVADGFEPRCDAFESGCNCDLCAIDEMTLILSKPDLRSEK